MTENFDEVEHVRKELEKLTAVKEMTSMPGWAIVCQHFSHVIQATQRGLELEEDFNKIIKLQERLRAFRAMLETVDSLCAQHSENSERLEDIIKDNNEREQYGLES